jgi:hypothetical protein
MKTFLAFVIICLFWPYAANAQSLTDREQADLIGPVKFVETYYNIFTMKDGKIVEGNRLLWHSVTYNINGNITERVSYDRLGSIYVKYLHTYDPAGRCIGYEEYYTNPDKTFTRPRKHIYTLDDNGNRIGYKVVEPDGTLEKQFTYKYDSNGNKIEEKYYDHISRLGGKNVYAYDDKGNQTSQTSYGADGSVNRKSVSTFDDRGNRIVQLKYEGDTLSYRIVSRYDEKRRVLEEETIQLNATPDPIRSHDPSTSKIVYAYDDKKRTKMMASYKPDGSLRERVIFTYDEMWNEIERTSFNADGTPSNALVQIYGDIHKPGSELLGSLSGDPLTEFKYDALGNWTRKTYLIRSRKDGKPQGFSTEERVIIYH